MCDPMTLSLQTFLRVQEEGHDMGWEEQKKN